MDPAFQELINQMGNLASSLKAFSDRDDDVLGDDKVKKDFVRLQANANKIRFDIEKFKDVLESSVSSFQEGPDAVTSSARFASVLEKFAEKATSYLV